MAKFVCIALFTVLMAGDQVKLVKTKVNEHITVSLPESFYPMSDSDQAQRFPSVRQPIGAYTNSSRMVDFSIKESATKWRTSDLEIARDFFKASLVNMYDRVTFLREGEIEEINKNKYAVFELETRINGDQYDKQKNDPIRKYVYVQYLLINGKTLVFTFTTPMQMKEEWQATAREIMQSIKVKGSI